MNTERVYRDIGKEIVKTVINHRSSSPITKINVYAQRMNGEHPGTAIWIGETVQIAFFTNEELNAIDVADRYKRQREEEEEG